MILPPSFKRTWQLSLLSFIIAAITGFFYRYGMLYPLPDSISFANIRHAHSHLMFFNWISPPVMMWMALSASETIEGKSIQRFAICIYVMIGFGFFSYPFFLFFGYHPVPIGSSSLPLAAIISGFVMITWYWFAWLYFKERKRGDKLIYVQLFDAAIIALLISSLGAWGVSVFQFTSIDSPLVSSAMTHFFLGTFTEGWVMLGVLGIMWQKMGKTEISFQTEWLWLPILLGSMLIFPFSLNLSIITPAMHITANIGLIVIALSLSLHLYLMVKNKLISGIIWKTVAMLIAVKILFQIIAVLPIDIWPGEHGLRVLYLHILLLGIASVMFIEVYHHGRDEMAKKIFLISVLLIITTLIFISGYWPVSFMVPGVYIWVAIGAFLPLIPATWLLLKTFKGETN